MQEARESSLISCTGSCIFTPPGHVGQGVLMKTIQTPPSSRFFNNPSLEFAMSRFLVAAFVLFAAIFAGCALEPLAETTGNDTTVDAIPGPEGPQGPMGPRGPQGETGTNGADGASCTVGPHPSGLDSCVLVTCGTTRQELCAPAGRDGTNGVDGTSCTVSTTPEGNHILVCSDGTSASWSDGEMGPMGPRGPQGDAGAEGSDGQDADPCSVRQNTNGTATMTCPDGTSVTWSTVTTTTPPPAPAPECTRNSDCTPRVPYCDGTTRVTEAGTCNAGTCQYTQTRATNSPDCRVAGTQCTRAADCRVATPYCEGTTLVSERAECDFGFCVRSSHSVVNTEICAVPPTGWHVEINVRDSRSRNAEVHLYHNDPNRNESADTYAQAPHTFRLSQIEACTWGVEIAVRSLPVPSTGPWWGCDAGTPSKRDLEIRIGGRLVTPAFRPHDHSCSGQGEGNLYLSPALLGCP